MSARVLHVIDSLEWSGGAERQLVMNLERFADDRLEHHLAVLNPLSHSRVDALHDVVVVHECPERGSLARFRWLLRTVRAERVALIHASLTEASRLSSLVGWLTHIPVLQSLVNIAYEPIRLRDHPNIRRWKLEVHRMLDRLQVRIPTVFHAISPRVAESWVENVGIDASKIRVVPRGVESFEPDHEVRRAWRHSIGVSDDDVVVLAVGRQEPQKRLWIAVEAVASLADANVRLVLVGREGASTPRLRESIDSIGVSRVVEVGEVADVSPMLHGSDIFLYPSLYEGLGVALLEAMSAGLPVLTTNVEPMNQIVTHEVDGFLCPLDGDPCWSESLEVLCRDEQLRRSLGMAARETIHRRFHISQVARQIEMIYLEMLQLEETDADSEIT